MNERNQRGLRFTLENEAQRVFGFCRSGWLPLSGACEYIVPSTNRFFLRRKKKKKKKINIYIYISYLSLSLSLSLEAVMMLVIVLVECEIWGIVERVRFPWRGDPDGLFVSRSQNWQPFVAAMAIRVPFLCLI